MYNHILQKQKKKQRCNRFRVISNHDIVYDENKNISFCKKGEINMIPMPKKTCLYVSCPDIWVEIKSSLNSNYFLTCYLILHMVCDVYKIKKSHVNFI